MSKKKFSDGFDSLFEELIETTDNSNKKTTQSDVDTLSDMLSDAFEQAIQEEKSAPKPKKKLKPKSRSKSFSGIDMLIRSTVRTSDVQKAAKGNTRRITILLDNEKVDKLKEIASSEHKLLKNIIKEIVSEYLEKT